jgi:molybdopterin-guanine dinucleotide biosynthesis protein A
MFPEGRPPGSSGSVSTAGAIAHPDPLLLRELDIAEPVTGIVLAGGRGKRMGWRDKAMVELAGRPLAAWVLDALKVATDRQIIVAREKGRLEELGVPVVVDQMAPRGPLTGIHAGLKASESDLVIVCACDLPLVRSDLLVHLARVIGPRHAAVPYVGEGEPPVPGVHSTAREAGLQPLLAAYRRRCIGSLEKLLVGGSAPTIAFVSLLRSVIVPPEEWQDFDPDGRSFFNVNTPEDLTAAAQMLNQVE